VRVQNMPAAAIDETKKARRTMLTAWKRHIAKVLEKGPSPSYR